MKSSSSIKNIALAAVKRSSVKSENWQFTTLEPTALPNEVSNTADELPLVLYFETDENWTLITTTRILGKVESTYQEVLFLELDDVIFGNYKRSASGKTIFRVIDFHGANKNFIMEAGSASMAYIYSIGIIEKMYKTSA